MKIIIYGFTGSGKSSLLESYFWPEGFKKVDLDEKIETLLEEESIFQFVNIYGEKAFRDLEFKVLKELLEDDSNYIIALGGGSVREDTLGLLECFKTQLKGVYLDLDFEKCWQRIKNDQSRLIVSRGKTFCESLFQARRSYFVQMTQMLDPYPLNFDKMNQDQS